MTAIVKWRVLMVDDNPAVREAIARSLARRGCRVSTAASGTEALDLVRQQPFDIVITDLNLPERSGLWLWRHTLIARPELRGRFVLIASEPLDARSLELFLESERFILKPLSLDLLWHQVESAMEQVPPPPPGDGPPAGQRPPLGPHPLSAVGHQWRTTRLPRD